MAADQALVTVTIDGVAVQVPRGTLLVEAAKKIKQEIPVYCYHTKLGPAGLCRICLVEIEGMPKLQIACNTAATDGMVVHTQNDKVNTGRSMVVELFLVNHPLDCPICDKGGECDLQDYAMAYGRGASDSVDGKTSKPKGVDLGPTIVLDEERCVVCQRCVRFDDIIADESQLVLKDRGYKDMIATATGDPYRHNFTGNVTELCPVGALTSKAYRFKSRPWDLARTQTTCTQCPVGCQTFVDTRFGGVQRVMSVESDDAISDGWLCDRGRYNTGFYASRDRVTQPLYRKNGEFVQIGWDDAFALWAKAISANASAAGAVGGGRLTNEEAYLLQHVFRAAGTANVDWRAGAQRVATPFGRNGTYAELEDAKLVLIAGESPAERAPVMDLRIKKAARKGARVVPVANATAAAAALQGATAVALVWDGVDGALAKSIYDAIASAQPLVFIASEQPNARGAEAMGVLPQGGGKSFDAMLAGGLQSLALFGVNPVLNHPDGAAAAAALAKIPFVVVSDIFLTETAQLATLVLPAKGAFEKSGTTIDLAGDVLPVNQSLDAPEGTLSDFEMLIGLAQQLGVDLPTSEALERTVVELAAKAGLSSLDSGRFAPDARDDKGVRPTQLFAGGGTSAHDERIAALRPVARTDADPIEEAAVEA
jgi:NADH-quinone oxidoreductase subunit G